jgi:hypothetical protein
MSQIAAIVNAAIEKRLHLEEQHETATSGNARDLIDTSVELLDSAIVLLWRLNQSKFMLLKRSSKAGGALNQAWNDLIDNLRQEESNVNSLLVGVSGKKTRHRELLLGGLLGSLADKEQMIDASYAFLKMNEDGQAFLKESLDFFVDQMCRSLKAILDQDKESFNFSAIFTTLGYAFTEYLVHLGSGPELAMATAVIGAISEIVNEAIDSWKGRFPDANENLASANRYLSYLEKLCEALRIWIEIANRVVASWGSFPPGGWGMQKANQVVV